MWIWKVRRNEDMEGLKERGLGRSLRGIGKEDKFKRPSNLISSSQS